MKFAFAAFPVIFLLFALYFGFIAYRVLIRKKPVIFGSRWLLILVSIGFLPMILMNLYEFKFTENEDLLRLLVPFMLLGLLVFNAFILQGFSLYGIKDTDFRSLLLGSLGKMGIKYTETMNKVVLDDLGTEINISFQEWLGTGMVRTKNSKKFDLKILMGEMRKGIESGTFETKKITAWFYLGFGILMIASGVGLLSFLPSGRF